MNVLVFGSTGYLGGHLTSHLASLGHKVTGFIRRNADAAQIRSIGAIPFIGDLDDPDSLGDLVLEQDAIIWAAQLMLDEERKVISSFINVLERTDKTLIFTGGTSMLSERTDGNWSENTYTEEDIFVPRRHIAPRLDIENMVRAASQRGVRGICIRPPLIWGNGGSKVISDLYHSARKTGAVCYVGKGLNLYSNVHIDDLTHLYALALEKGVAGALYHAVSGEINYRTIAETIARHLNVPARSVSVEEAAQIWDRFTGPIVFSSCSRTRSPRARKELGWAPRDDRLDILQDCTHPAYAEEEDRSLPAWVRAPS